MRKKCKECTVYKCKKIIKKNHVNSKILFNVQLQFRLYKALVPEKGQLRPHL